MATLAVDTPRTYEKGDMNDVPVIASDIIYEGAAVSENGSGYARPLNTADNYFLGFAQSQADNSSGSAGDINVKLVRKGSIKLAVTSVAIDDIGKIVYATDDNTFDITSTTSPKVGTVKRFVESGVAIVDFINNVA